MSLDRIEEIHRLLTSGGMLGYSYVIELLREIERIGERKGRILERQDCLEAVQAVKWDGCATPSAPDWVREQCIDAVQKRGLSQ